MKKFSIHPFLLLSLLFIQGCALILDNAIDLGVQYEGEIKLNDKTTSGTWYYDEYKIRLEEGVTYNVKVNHDPAAHIHFELDDLDIDEFGDWTGHMDFDFVAFESKAYWFCLYLIKEDIQTGQWYNFIITRK